MQTVVNIEADKQALQWLKIKTENNEKISHHSTEGKNKYVLFQFAHLSKN